MNPADIQISFASEPRLLKAVRGLVRGYINALGFVHERAEEVVLAVDEACANAIRHSYGGQPGRNIDLELRSDDHFVVIELRDSGTPMPAQRAQPRKALPPDVATLRPGGLGIQLIYQVFDDVEFHPGAEQGNQVIMRLHRPEATHGQDRKATEG